MARNTGKPFAARLLIRLPRTLLTQLNRAAGKQHRPTSEYVRLILREALDKELQSVTPEPQQ